LLALEERDAILFGLHARGGACAKAIDEEVEGRHAWGGGPWGYRGYEETVKAWETLYPDDEDSLLQLAAFITANCPDWEYLAPGQESMQSLRRW